MRKFSQSLIAALACSCAVLPFAAQSQDKAIRIGVVMPISGPGSYFGVMGREGIDLAMEQYEASISRRLARGGAADRLDAGGSDRVPDAYRQSIARYYQSLAKLKK